jgi:hypothetical protein
MGVSLGGSYASSKGTSTASSTGAQDYTYSPQQAAVRNLLGDSLATNLRSSQQGTLSPGVEAQKTQAAEDINRTSTSGLQSRIEQFLGARGFGKSGATGKATLESELSREGQQGANAANFAQIQQNQNNATLMAALNYAFTQLGLTTQESGTTSGKSSGWDIAAKGAAIF